MEQHTTGNVAPAEDPNPPAIRPRTEKERKRAVISSFLGSTVEYYDFLLYTSAAGLVFPKILFNGMDQGLATTLAFATLLAGYLARPLGGILFGHFGDKIGRKNMLFITMLIMGVVSFAIGLMPTNLGPAFAGIALTILRVIQGIAVGGEWAGATLMAMEHSKGKSRGIGASMAVTGGPAGAVLSTLVLGLFMSLPADQFAAWGWRMPFLLSVVVVAIALYLRWRVTESPEFEAARARGDVHTGVPLVKLFKEHPKEVLLGCFAGVAALFMQGFLASFMVKYLASTSEKIAAVSGEAPALRSDILLYLLTFSSFLHIFTIPFFAHLSDKYGRKKVMMSGAVVGALLVWPMIALFHSNNYWLIALAFIIGNPIIQASQYGPIGAFLAEKFSPETRYTGVSITFQVSSILGAGVAPLVGQWLVPAGNGTLWLIGVYFVVLLVISTTAIALSKETYRNPAVRKESRDTEIVDDAVVQGY
ncbi:MFS family permease [Neomicrococcus aestuarii]|uniref:MFS family permease n=1 Tax=Neomicrococcus aestuarii TaxID=556325 RepID=A0A7W8TUC0_9MICC|nr:MFS transporter [Neomicrococcus aestuarii]MBB5512999.1 MFS family permease [Neomicrococcus aestuarii]